MLQKLADPTRPCQSSRRTVVGDTHLDNGRFFKCSDGLVTPNGGPRRKATSTTYALIEQSQEVLSEYARTEGSEISGSLSDVDWTFYPSVGGAQDI